MTFYVQFADASKEKIVSVFCGPQDPQFHSNLGEVEGDDPRYTAFRMAVPTFASENEER